MLRITGSSSRTRAAAKIIKMAPNTQRVVVHHEPGDASVLKVEERPIPQRQQGEVLIKQYGTSVNPVDFKMRAMNKDNLPKVCTRHSLSPMRFVTEACKPCFVPTSHSPTLLLQILGGDISGIVEEAEENSKVGLLLPLFFSACVSFG